MQTFMERYPEFRKQSHTVSKHVAIMGELARLVADCGLMDVSAFEQELAVADEHGVQMRELAEKLADPMVKVRQETRGRRLREGD